MKIIDGYALAGMIKKTADKRRDSGLYILAGLVNGFVNDMPEAEAYTEAKKHLENLQKVNEDLEKRIDIMEEGTDNGWIPVTLGLPETNDSYFGRHIIVCDERKQVFPLRYVRRNIKGKTVERWQEEDGRIYGRANIIAWQYMPEPLKEGE